MKRIVGVANAEKDGAVYWQGTDNVDTAAYQGYLRSGKGAQMEVLRQEGEEVWSRNGKRTLDDQSIVQLRLTKAGGDAKEDVIAVLQDLADSLPLQTIKSNDVVS